MQPGHAPDGESADPEAGNPPFSESACPHAPDEAARAGAPGEPPRHFDRGGPREDSDAGREGETEVVDSVSDP